MELKFTYYPDPLLRRKAEQINGEPTQEILDLLAQMKDICTSRKGIGLAAHQVGLVLPAIIYGVPVAPDKYELVGVVNPQIVGNGQFPKGCYNC